MKTVSATNARVHFGRLLRDVVERGEVIEVARNGKATAVILSSLAYRKLIGDTQADQRDVFERIEAIGKQIAASETSTETSTEDIVAAIRSARDTRTAELDAVLR